MNVNRPALLDRILILPFDPTHAPALRGASCMQPARDEPRGGAWPMREAEPQRT